MLKQKMSLIYGIKKIWAYQTSWIETNKDIHTNVSMKTVNGIFALVEKVCKKYDKNPFWRMC